MYGELFVYCLSQHNMLCFGVYRFRDSHIEAKNHPKVVTPSSKRYVICNPSSEFRLMQTDLVYVLEQFDPNSKASSCASLNRNMGDSSPFKSKMEAFGQASRSSANPANMNMNRGQLNASAFTHYEIGGRSSLDQYSRPSERRQDDHMKKSSSFSPQSQSNKTGHQANEPADLERPRNFDSQSYKPIVFNDEFSFMNVPKFNEGVIESTF